MDEMIFICSEVCDSGEQIPLLNSSFGVVFMSFLLLAWVPSLIIVSITATWSYLIFKKSYTGGDDQLNRRILSIPFIMPTVVIATNLLLPLILRMLINQILLQFPFGDYHLFWATFLRTVISLVTQALIGLCYAILLLYLMPPLRRALRKVRSQTVALAEQ